MSETKRPDCFKEPVSLDEAIKRHAELSADVARIQGQLSARRPVGMVPQAEWDKYKAWKHDAVIALSVRQREAAFLKAWIKERRRNLGQCDNAGTTPEERASNYDKNDALSLLRAAMFTLRNILMESDPEDVSLAEQRLVDDIQEFLTHKA